MEKSKSKGMGGIPLGHGGKGLIKQRHGPDKEPKEERPVKLGQGRGMETMA